MPVTAALPSRIIRWIGLKRPKPPVCGPFSSTGMASEKTRPGPHQAGRRDDVARADVVQRPELVLGSPATPVGAALGQLADRVDVRAASGIDVH